MWKQRLVKAFALLLILQSVGAVADAHASHQSGSEHLTFEHDHHDQPLNISNPSDKSNIDFDCHHCCHCHGIHHHWIATSINLPQPKLSKQRYLIHRYFLPLPPYESLLRPPIA